MARLRTRVITPDGKTLYDFTADTTGQSGAFTAWGANDAQFLRDALDLTTYEMAGETLRRVFGVSASVTPDWPDPIDRSQESDLT